MASAAGACGAALVVLPLLLALPGAGAFILWLAYLLRKGYLLRQAQRAIRELRLEEQFVAHVFEADALRRCLHRNDHLWAASRTLHGLRALLASSEQPAGGVTTRHLRGQYRRAFRRLRPASALLDLLLALGLLWSVALAVGPRALGALTAMWSVLAMPLLLLAEATHLVVQRRLKRQFARLAHALSRWTLNEGFVEALRDADAERPYRHTLLYRAPVWFGTPISAAGPPTS